MSALPQKQPGRAKDVAKKCGTHNEQNHSLPSPQLQNEERA
jgi:hypothetical protein